MCQCLHVYVAETPEVGGPGGTCPPKIWDFSKPYSDQGGADYAPHVTTGPPIFLDDVAPLLMINLDEPEDPMGFSYTQRAHDLML